MPVQGRPVIEYWLHALAQVNVDSVLVNLHHQADEVRAFLDQEEYRGWVQTTYEPELLGTGGSLLKNREFFSGYTTLIAHVDNLCVCDLNRFINFHQYERPENTVMTMMTFVAPNPQACGIAELDDRGVVVGFHEKVADPPGDLASAAVFLFGPKVFNALALIGREEFDFSREVIPEFLGKIAAWHNDKHLVDIGTFNSLESTQTMDLPILPEKHTTWHRDFRNHPIQDWHEAI